MILFSKKQHADNRKQPVAYFKSYASGFTMKANSGGFVAFFAPSLMVALLATGLAMAGISASNSPAFDPVDTDAHPVKLVQVASSSSPAGVGVENDISFEIRSSKEVPNASLVIHLSTEGAGVIDPSVVQVQYKQPGFESFSPVALSSDGSQLTGVLRSGWDILADFHGTANLQIILPSTAPVASYYVYVEVVAPAANGFFTATHATRLAVPSSFGP